MEIQKWNVEIWPKLELLDSWQNIKVQLHKTWQIENNAKRTLFRIQDASAARTTTTTTIGSKRRKETNARSLKQVEMQYDSSVIMIIMTILILTSSSSTMSNATSPSTRTQGTLFVCLKPRCAINTSHGNGAWKKTIKKMWNNLSIGMHVCVYKIVTQSFCLNSDHLCVYVCLFCVWCNLLTLKVPLCTVDTHV